MSNRNLKARLTVIGGGGAGLCAAVTAMQNGVKDIVVLEKSHFIGGNSRMAGGHLFGPESRDKCDEVFRTILAASHYKVDPKNLRAYVDNSIDTVAFFNSIGIPYHYGHDNASFMDDDKHPFGNFVNATRKMTAMLLEGGNTILKDTGGVAIEKDENGKVCRVIAETADGEKVTVDTEAAVITTGGFGGNSELLHHYFPNEYSDNFHRDALPLDGSGIDVARSAGAKLNNYAVIIKENAYSCDSYNGAPNRAAHNPMSLWVNKMGERFADESYTRNESSNALVRQPDMIGYAIFDTKVMESIPSVMGDSPFAFDPRPALEEDRRRTKEWVCITDDMGEIADWMGCDREDLLRSVEEYNSDCDAGHDRLFCKDPKFLIPLRKAPFYAIKFRPIIIDTIGPIVVNERMQVLGENNKPIAGLYAAGVCTAGWQGNDYHPWGFALGYATTSGRIAGKSIADYLGE